MSSDRREPVMTSSSDCPRRMLTYGALALELNSTNSGNNRPITWLAVKRSKYLLPTKRSFTIPSGLIQK